MTDLKKKVKLKNKEKIREMLGHSSEQPKNPKKKV